MTNALQQYNFNQELSPCRVAISSFNLASLTGSLANGVYQNGNNGIGATITFPALVITMDGVKINLGDSVLLILGDATAGIYICTQTGTAQTILQRRNDFQSIEQMKAGQFVTIGAGTNMGGASYTLIEPLPNVIGTDNISFMASMASMSSTTLNTATPGQVSNFTSFLTDFTAVNDPTAVLDGLAGFFQPTGTTVINQGFGLIGELFSLGGTYLNTGPIGGVLGKIDLGRGSVVNGANIFAILGLYDVAATTPTDLSNMVGIGFINSTAQTIGQVMAFQGAATYFINTSLATGSYYLAAGVGAGSAGDPTKCNAAFVLKCIIDGVINYIPTFISNA